MGRRQFLRRSAILAAGTPALVAFLDACSRSTPSSSGPSLTLAAPDNPVTWDIAEDNKPIADSPPAAREGTLQLYSYADYVSPDAVKSFGDKYGVQVQISTFCRRGDHQDPRRERRSTSTSSYDQISRMVSGNLIRPLNHSYIPDIGNV